MVWKSLSKLTTPVNAKGTMKMPSVLLRILFAIFFLVMIPQRSDGQLHPQWCIADEQASTEELQMAMDWACGRGGADCKQIQRHGPCYLHNTVKDHASYAFNNYWQNYKHKGGSCYFNGAAYVTDLDPSHGSCKFEYLP